MKALTVIPGRAGSAAVVDQLPLPTRSADELLLEGLLVGICGTDREIVAGHYGAPPTGEERLILGHESLGRVIDAPSGSSFRRGDLVVGIVRRPDPLPCRCCAAGEWDMCMNGLYTERGIRGEHGFASQQFLLQPEFAVKVPEQLGKLGILVEPTSVVAKAWEQVERIAARSSALAPKNVLVTGAGPVGLLAALLAVQRGFHVTVLDRVSSGPKPDLVRRLGAKYHDQPVTKLATPPDIVLECTGAESLVAEVLGCTAHNSIVCLAGVSSGARKVSIVASTFNDGMVLENDVVFGSVNANRRHYDLAVSALQEAEPAWLSALITRTVPLARFEEALTPRDGDIKVTLDLSQR